MLALHAFPDSQEIAREMAGALGAGASLHAVEVHRFPDGESRVRVAAEAAPHAVLVRSLHDPNPKLVEVLLAADALRRSGVVALTLVAPYLGYMRQDRAFRSGEAISQRVVADVLSRSFDRVLTVEAHLHRIRALSEVFHCEAKSLSAAPAIADHLRDRSGAWCVVGPDEESERWAAQVAGLLGWPHHVCRKSRSGDRQVSVEVPPLGDSTHALIVDDIASSGATLAAVARTLRARGVARCEAVIVHALLDEAGHALLQAAGIDAVMSCNGVPHATNRISLAPVLAAAVETPVTRRSCA